MSQKSGVAGRDQQATAAEEAVTRAVFFSWLIVELSDVASYL
jgi:hypothetical protein